MTYAPIGSRPNDGETMTGITSGTCVATTTGWRAVEDVLPGDFVLTFDGGMQRVSSVECRSLWEAASDRPRATWPLNVPVGALGNQCDLVLLPDQPVMLDSDVAQRIFGDPFTLVRASALEGTHGITRLRPDNHIRVVSLFFETEQIVFADIGALFLCPQDLALRNSVQPSDRIAEDQLPLNLATDLTRIIGLTHVMSGRGATA